MSGQVLPQSAVPWEALISYVQCLWGMLLE